MKKYGPYLVVIVLSYWAYEIYRLLAYLGVIVYDEMTAKAWMVSSLVFHNSLLIAFFSLLFGSRRGFAWTFPILVSLLFVPSVIYTYVAYPAEGMEAYLLPYGLISLVFISFGTAIRKMLKNLRKNT
ncbi:hypothetical protein [Streptococcus merionis]|uniref:hypothetical protein n=1 Tax=Streptococcus merionis TaxID=400065 RepID=UPI0026EC9109|nr:hypothetical protein [Streptococcus merionis]